MTLYSDNPENMDMPVPDLNQRVAAIESLFSRVNLGEWSNDQEVPYWLAIRINPARLVLDAQLVSTIQMAAQAKTQQGSQGEGQNRFFSELIDDWCGTPVPGRPPRPHWSDIVSHLGELGDRYPANSMLSEAAFDLARRTLNRAHELHNRTK